MRWTLPRDGPVLRGRRRGRRVQNIVQHRLRLRDRRAEAMTSSTRQMERSELLEGLRQAGDFALNAGPARNRVLRVEANQAIVDTDRAPRGRRRETRQGASRSRPTPRGRAGLTRKPRRAWMVTKLLVSLGRPAAQHLPEVVVEKTDPRVLRWSQQDHATTDEAELEIDGSKTMFHPLQLSNNCTTPARSTTSSHRSRIPSGRSHMGHAGSDPSPRTGWRLRVPRLLRAPSGSP